MLLYILFFIGSLTLLMGMWETCGATLQAEVANPEAAQMVQQAQWLAVADVAKGPVLLALVAVYIFVVFGYLSRRCERQADLFGCRAVSCYAFVSALEKVADLNGIPRHRHNWLASWQHPSIAQRVEFVMRMHENPALERPFQRSLWRLKLGLMSCLTVGLLLVAWKLGPEQVMALLSAR
jgi:STE24 endopeptidase